MENLISLRNTLSLVETKGNNTLIMADCMRFLERMIAEEQAKLQEAEANEKKPSTKKEK